MKARHRRSLGELRDLVAVLSERAGVLRAVCAACDRSIRRGQRPAASLKLLREARADLWAVILDLGSARVELAHAELWAVYRPPVQLDLFLEVA